MIARTLVCSLLSLAATACQPYQIADDQAYLTCEPTGRGPVVCLLDGTDVNSVGEVELGIGAFVDAYLDTWTPEQLGRALSYTAIFWGVAHTNAACPCPRGCSAALCLELHGGDDGCPCAAPCTSGGCMDWAGVVTEVWAPTDAVSPHTGEWSERAPWETALHHELVHAVEWHVEGVVDYTHELHPWRYGGPVAELARALWRDRLGYEPTD